MSKAHISRIDAAKFSDALEAARKARRWSQMRLAEVASKGGVWVTPANVVYFENSPRRPLQRRSQLAAILDVLEESLPISREEINHLAGGV